MNSNTTDRRPSKPRGRVRFRHRPPAQRKKPVHAPSPSSSALSLQPIPCDTAPLKFDSLSLDARILEGIKDLGFIETRPIQSAVIPLLLSGHDLIACAETGTGKTAAFVVPILQRLLAHNGTNGGNGGSTAPARSRVLVLAPTRELAVQIEDDIHGLAYHTSVTSAAVYGGVEMGGQERALKAGVDIIVATPGRLIDHLRHQNADHGAIELLVLDEADRMMDMGFWPDVRRIIATLPESRQTLLFSATMPDEIVRQAVEITRDAKYVQVGQRSAPAKNITHSFERVAGGEKVNWLINYLRRSEGPVLVLRERRLGRIGCRGSWRRPESGRLRCMRIAARISAGSRLRASRVDDTRFWLPLTLPRAASTLTAFTP